MEFTRFRDAQPAAISSVTQLVDWQLAAQSLEVALASTDGLKSHHACIIGQFGNAGHLLKLWARPGVQVLEAPSLGSLLEGNAEIWPPLLTAADGSLVIPALERCFLRHQRGLRLVRRLVETAWGAHRRLIIGCDVWAWKYLQHAVQMDALCPHPLTTAPMLAYPEQEDPVSALALGTPDSRMKAYVLHTLLIHCGMTAAILPFLIPFHKTQILKTLTELCEECLVIEQDGFWRVAPSRQIEIRAQLATARFWVSDV